LFIAGFVVFLTSLLLAVTPLSIWYLLKAARPGGAPA
jgi:hypothetical protein